MAAILFCFVGQGLEVRQTMKAEDFRTFGESQGVKVDKVPDWVLGKYRRYEHLHAQEWLQTGIAALGLSFFVCVGLAAVRPRRRQPPDSDGSPQATS